MAAFELTFPARNREPWFCVLFRLTDIERVLIFACWSEEIVRWSSGN
jgi:hypothetical protein